MGLQKILNNRFTLQNLVSRLCNELLQIQIQIQNGRKVNSNLTMIENLKALKHKMVGHV